MSLSRELRDEGAHSNRVRALSDGVFAIVLTFLIFRLDIGKLADATSDQELMRAIREQASPILGYFLSFFIIGGFWMMHQRVFRHLQSFNRETFWLNLQFLFFLSILPLTTSIHAGNHELKSGWFLYAGNVTVAGMGLLAMWLRAVRDNLIDKGVDRDVRNFYLWRLTAIPVVFLLSILVATRNVILAQWVPLLIPVFSGFVHQYFSRRGRAQETIPELHLAA